MNQGSAFFVGAAVGFLLCSLLIAFFSSSDEEEPRLEDFGVGS